MLHTKFGENRPGSLGGVRCDSVRTDELTTIFSSIDYIIYYYIGRPTALQVESGPLPPAC